MLKKIQILKIYIYEAITEENGRKKFHIPDQKKDALREEIRIEG